VDVVDRFLDRLVQIALVERDTLGRSLNPINTYYGIGDNLGPAPVRPGLPADCLATTFVDPSSGRTSLMVEHLEAVGGQKQ
jgi:hypothetical protein